MKLVSWTVNIVFYEPRSQMDVIFYNGCDMYIIDKDTSIWDLGSYDSSTNFDTVKHIGYKMICSGIHRYEVVCNGMCFYAQWYSGT
jgi:hypothetical protein